MSFSTEIKQEIAYNSLKDCCKKAELASVLVLSAKFIDNDLILKSENPTSVRRVVQLVKDLYATETRLNVYKKNNLDKSNVYELVIFDKAKEILHWEPTVELREGLVKTIEYFDKKLAND